jgi:hypothetical protein
VTAEGTAVERIVVVRAKGMKEAWYLASSRADLSGAETKKLYGRRFTIEKNLRDTKDLHFGLGLSATHIGDPARRDRLLLLVAFAEALLTLLGEFDELVPTRSSSHSDPRLQQHAQAIELFDVREGHVPQVFDRRQSSADGRRQERQLLGACWRQSVAPRRHAAIARRVGSSWQPPERLPRHLPGALGVLDDSLCFPSHSRLRAGLAYRSCATPRSTASSVSATPWPINQRSFPRSILA